MAKEGGVSFKNAFSQGTFTLPSIISIHTSLYPQSHTVTTILRDRLPEGIKTLADTLKAYGYKTGLFVRLGNPHTFLDTGLGNGFDDRGHFRPEHKSEDRQKAFGWIKRNKKNTFFFSAHLRYLHLPYCPPSRYKQKFAKDYKGNIISSRQGLRDFQLHLIEQDLKIPDSQMCTLFKKEIASYPDIFQGRMDKNKFDKFFTLAISGSLQRKIDFSSRYDEERVFLHNIDKNDSNDIRHLEDLYDACISRMDDEFIGPLLSRLKALKLYDKTMIIIIGDHGEQFLEHGALGHGDFYDEVLHIPLIIKLPKDIKYSNSHVSDLAQQIDIMPTVLDVLNKPIPQQAQGISLKYFWEDGDTPKRNNYVHTGDADENESIRSAEYKLIYRGNNGHHELYNLKDDPKEKNNIYDPESGIVKKIKEDLTEWKRNLVFYARNKNESFEDLSKITRERIRQTGYW